MGSFNVTFSEGELFDLSMTDSEEFDTAVSEEIVIHETKSHNELAGRDAEDCHPITAITGLESKLSDIESGTVTDAERESWNNKSRVFRNASGALIITF